MPPVRSSASAYHTYIVALVLSFSVIMPMCFYYTKKKLVYITITAFFNYQPFFYLKYTKSNIYFSCNVCLVSENKYIFLFY